MAATIPNAHSKFEHPFGSLRDVATRPTRPALRERYDRRQQRVVTEAARVFAERGYDQTSVQQLADELGIAAGGLYHYFGGKEQLLITICDQLTDGLVEEAAEAAAAADPPEEELRAIVRIWVARVIEHRHHMLVFQQERHVIERGEQWRALRETRKRFERLVARTLERIDGLAGDRRLAVSALLGMVNHTPQWFRPRGRLGAEEIADGYVDLILGRSSGRDR
jgi:TetR/AcrR family transcriptional regulator, cholesterol catabolism regulator